MADRHVPIRTCIGCRASEPRGSLVRYVLAAGEPPRIVRDERGAAAGRGAWLHDRSSCWDAAVRRRAFRRALRINGDEVLGPTAPHEENNGVGHVTSPN